jgi:hypothetical protein
LAHGLCGDRGSATDLFQFVEKVADPPEAAERARTVKARTIAASGTADGLA